MKDWHVGQRVVCVQTWFDPINPRDFFVGAGVVEGKVYTIREIGRLHPLYNEICIRVEELINPVVQYSSECTFELCFRISRFRPLDESRLDQFRVHLNPKKVEEPA